MLSYCPPTKRLAENAALPQYLLSPNEPSIKNICVYFNALILMIIDTGIQVVNTLRF